jgi:ABC-type antimicrobial peptide transport system permease subunit
MRPDVRDVATVIRNVFANAAPQMPAVTPQPLMDALNARIGPSLLLARLLSLISLLAVSLAAVGLYGVVPFAVAERAREIGIRMALGAHTPRVVGLVLRRLALTLGAGILAGLLGAIVLGRVVEGYLFGVTALEPAVYGAGALLFAVIGLLAALLPLRAATRMDPVQVLRAD